MTTLRPSNNHLLCLGIDQENGVEGAQPRLFPCQGLGTQRWERIGPSRKMLRMEGTNLCIEPTKGPLTQKPFHLIQCHERQYRAERGPRKTLQFAKADHLYFLGYDAFGNLITKSKNEPQNSFLGWDDVEDNTRISVAESDFKSCPVSRNVYF